LCIPAKKRRKSNLVASDMGLFRLSAMYWALQKPLLQKCVEAERKPSI